MHTNRQNIFQIRSLFELLRSEYERCFNKKLTYRTITSDYSWAKIHAIIEGLNCQTVDDYINRIYYMLTLGADFHTTERTWYISCAAHTMNRFSTKIKKMVKNEKVRQFINFSFSLMLNALTLDQISNVFENLCVVLLSKTKNKQTVKAYKQIKQLLKHRDSLNDDIDEYEHCQEADENSIEEIVDSKSTIKNILLLFMKKLKLMRTIH